MRSVGIASLLVILAFGGLIAWLELGSRASEEMAIPAVASGAEDGPVTPPPVVAGADGLPAPVDQAMLEEGPFGPLPRIADDGREAWHFYARPFDDPDLRPIVAIVITNLGLNQSITQQAIDLQGEVTLAFSPYASNLPELGERARAAGHEALVMAPMEPVGFPANDPGEMTLLASASGGANINKLKWVMSRFQGFAGIAGFMGSRFINANQALQPVFGELKSRGLLYLNHNPTLDSSVASVAAQVSLPMIDVDIVVDEEPSLGSIDSRLAELIELAVNNGSAVGIGQPYPVTLRRIAAWSATLEGQGVVLAPASAVAVVQIR